MDLPDIVLVLLGVVIAVAAFVIAVMSRRSRPYSCRVRS